MSELRHLHIDQYINRYNIRSFVDVSERSTSLDRAELVLARCTSAAFL
jgi:hypothetical protein